MRLHWIQHVPYEGLGCIAPWAATRGFGVTSSALHAGEPLPRTPDFDWLVVMGGPMGVGDTAEYPWLAPEKALIAEAIGEGRKVVGVCLGAQLIAAALGADVTRNAQKEIGWYDVTCLPGTTMSRRLGPTFEAFHWHGDTFSIPAGAVHAARSAVCERQAFTYGANVLALQFHLEATAESARSLADNSVAELAAGGEFVQSAEAMLVDVSRFERTNARMWALLDALVSGAL